MLNKTMLKYLKTVLIDFVCNNVEDILEILKILKVHGDGHYSCENQENRFSKNYFLL